MDGIPLLLAAYQKEKISVFDGDIVYTVKKFYNTFSWLFYLKLLYNTTKIISWGAKDCEYSHGIKWKKTKTDYL